MKEIDQRSKDRLLFQCTCSGSHFVMFDILDWDDYKEFYIQIIDPPTKLWDRIKNAIIYIFKGEDLYWMEISLTEKDLDQVIELINKYKELKKPDYEEKK